MRDDNFPRDNAVTGLVSRCSMGEDRDWEKSQMEGQHELNLTCGTAQHNKCQCSCSEKMHCCPGSGGTDCKVC